MGVIEPLALGFSALYAVLVLFYLWERWRRRVVVPSLLLWETLREDTVRARRLRPDLLFVLQCVLLACLIAGLARPYLRGGPGAALSERHILVLDTSASMQAREGPTSRFEQSRQQALDLLGHLPAESEVMFVTAARQPETAVLFTREHGAVEQALRRASPTDTAGDLSVALAFVDSVRQRQDLPTAVDVFTDLPRSQLPENLRAGVTLFQVGETDDNLGIEALQIFQGRFQDPRRARAYVLVQNFAHREGHGFLTMRLDDQVVHHSGFTIAARESKGFLIHDFPGPGRVTAQLEVTDALVADNTAYGWIRPLRPVRVLLVSPPSSLGDELRALAAATPALQLTVVAPEQYRADQAAHSDVAIFHRLVPDPPPAVNTLYIYPPKDNPLFASTADATDVEVLDWNSRHSALQPLQPLAALPLQHARIITPPEWSDVLLWSRTGDREFPLAVAGEHNGYRVACIAFDLEAERLLSSDNVNFFLFFMNMLGWLSPDAQDAVVMQTGEVQTLGPFPTQPVRVRAPDGQISTLPGTTVTVQPLRVGEYRISSDGTRRSVLANLFDPLESDIGRAGKEPVLASTTAGATVPIAPPGDVGPRTEFGPWLYWGALALLVIEWWLARRMLA